jgi:hypothetical protein
VVDDNFLELAFLTTLSDVAVGDTNFEGEVIAAAELLRPTAPAT